MGKLFLTILNMSLTGAFVVAVICLARLLLKKAPKIISYCLWVVAGFRLAFPFSIESLYSLIPFKAQPIPPDIVTSYVPSVESGVTLVNNTAGGALSPTLTDLAANVNTPQFWTMIGSWVWFAGSAVMLIYGVVSYIRLRHNLSSAIRVEGNIYETDCIKSPFVSGIFKPKIFIPPGLFGQERQYIILHERTHIRRFDHVFKFVAYFILCLHWFNPLAWVAFLLMGVDMEMSCDERVLKELGGEIKKNYSVSLLSLAVGRRVISGSPLAFGEDDVKNRIKNVLKFKKSSRIVVALAIVFVTVLGLGLMMSKVSDGVAAEQATDDVEGLVSANVAAGEAGPGVVAETVVDDTVMISESISETSDFGGMANTGMVYSISDYYNEDGKFSTLGLGLTGKDSERALTVSDGDVLIVGTHQYKVTVESLSLSFYTQPSPDQVIKWWTDYLSSWAESGKVTAVN